MSNHDAAYFRQRRHSLRIPERDQFSDAKFRQSLERLPWPRKVSGEYATVAELAAEALQLSRQSSENIDNTSRCGCQRRHNHNVPQVVAGPSRVSLIQAYGCACFWDDCRADKSRAGFQLA